MTVLYLKNFTADFQIIKYHFVISKQEEEAWEGVSDYPKEASEKGEQPKRDKASFLRFLHYLDSENLTADKNVQPGADPDYYLEELKKARYEIHKSRKHICSS